MSSPTIREAPSPPGDPLIGHARSFAKDRLGFFLRVRAEFGDVVRLRLPGSIVYLVSRPEQAARVLVDNADNYSKQTRSIELIRDRLLGESIFTSEGPAYERRRDLATSAFAPGRAEVFADATRSAAKEMLERLARVADAGRPIDLVPELFRATMRSLVAGAFGIHSFDVDGLVAALSVVKTQLGMRASRPFHLPLAIPTRQNRRYREAVRALDEISAALVNERRNLGRDDDALSLLLAAEPADGPVSRNLRNDLLTLIAGDNSHEAIAWALHILLDHGSIETDLKSSLANVVGLHDAPDVASLRDLSLLRGVLDETLRLYPPVWGLSRRVRRDDVIGGCRVSAGAVVFTSPWVTHRHPDIWPEPDAFRPSRFMEASTPDRHPLAYFPYGAGRRSCMARHVAPLISQTVLAAVVRNFRLSRAAGPRTEPEALLTLRPKNGLRVMLRREV